MVVVRLENQVRLSHVMALYPLEVLCVVEEGYIFCCLGLRRFEEVRLAGNCSL